MGECFVQQLKGVIDNNNLPILGYEKYRVNMSSNSTTMGLCFTEEANLILVDGKWTNSGSREKTIIANAKYFPGVNNITPDGPSQDFCTILIPKYTCYRYTNMYPQEDMLDVDLTGYKYITDYQSLTYSPYIDLRSLRYEGSQIVDRKYGVKGLEYAPLDKVEGFCIAGLRVVGDSLDLTPLGADGNLSIFDLGSIVDNVHGSLDNLGKSNINWTSATYFPSSKEVSIDLVNFVNNRRIAGATTGTITFRFLGTITVKANGVTLDVPVQSNDVLVWDASSITLNGNPIT